MRVTVSTLSLNWAIDLNYATYATPLLIRLVNLSFLQKLTSMDFLQNI